MLLEVAMQNSCIISYKVPPLKRRLRDIQIVIIKIFFVVSSVGIKRVDYNLEHVPPTKTQINLHIRAV